MADPWLHIVGIGEDGLDGLVPATRAVVEAAEVIIGGTRHHTLAGNAGAERIAWPSPFDAMIDVINGLRGRRVVILVTGDPLWFSVGARIGRAIDPKDIIYHPQLSAFQLAAARMGWSLPDVETLTVHGRPVEQMIAFIQPDARLLVLTTGAQTPAQIAAFLTMRGFGKSRMSVLAAMGGKDEARFDGTAEGWDHTVPAFNTLAVECIAAPDAALLPRVPGLADNLFQSDGTMTKQEVRAATVAKLMPMRGALLWDIGCGCGSVAIEWMRAARYAQAIGIEPRAPRVKGIFIADSTGPQIALRDLQQFAAPQQQIEHSLDCMTHGKARIRLEHCHQMCRCDGGMRQKSQHGRVPVVQTAGLFETGYLAENIKLHPGVQFCLEITHCDSLSKQ